MCGIVGVAGVREPGIGSANCAESLLNLGHRGPDSSGLTSAGLFVVLGHSRLSVVELSSAGDQPMWSGDGRWLLTYNGEIYDTRELIGRFGIPQSQLKGHSDTEVLVEAIARAGVKQVVNQVDGMFAFGAWDSHEECLWLARDRFGEKPLYFSARRDRLVFASELSGLIPLLDEKVDVDPTSLWNLVKYGSVVGSRAIFSRVEQVLPGEVVRFDRKIGSIERTRFWSSRSAARSSRSTHSTPSDDDIESAIRESVSSRMVSDVPLGAFLSGGVDSSLVVALMSKLSPGPVKTFTIGFQNRQYDEATFARRVAELLGTDHTEWIMSDRDVLDVIPRLGSMFSEPFADSSQIPTYLVSKLARQHVTVALTGDGGDELFGGYERYRALRTLDRLVTQPLRYPTRLVGKAAGRISIDRWNSLAQGTLGRALPSALRFRLGERVHKFSRLTDGGPGAFYDRMMSTNVDPSRFLAFDAPTPEPVYDLRDSGEFSTLEMAMLADTETYLPDDILTKVDRASMANSLEVRVPLLNPKVFDLAWQLSDDQRIGRKEGKLALRRILKRHLPAELVDRPKMGFGVPLADWLRGPLRTWADDLLSSDDLSRHGFWKVDAVQEAWTKHRLGSADQSVELWPILMFQAWAAEWYR